MRRLVGRAPLFLGRWWLPPATLLLALLLVSPSLGVGPMGDDFMHMARVDPRLHVPGFAYAPFDLFTFVSGEPSQRAVLLEEGVFGWWMAPDFRMSFWRPLSSLTHVLDHLLWPRSSVLAHAHSMLWFAALLAVLAGSMYLNPLDEPTLYLRALLERLPVLLAAQIGVSLSDVWLLLPTPAKLAAYTLALLVLVVFAVLLAPLWRQLPACRFWALGAVLSLPPVCATFPMDGCSCSPVWARWRRSRSSSPSGWRGVRSRSSHALAVPSLRRWSCCSPFCTSCWRRCCCRFGC